MSGITIGSIANYECFDGFSLEGNEIRTCVDGGVWSGVEPVCTRKYESGTLTDNRFRGRLSSTVFTCIIIERIWFHVGLHIRKTIL